MRIFNRQNRILIKELVRTDFKLRYQGSVLGYAWSLLRPLFLFAILYVVFDKFLKLGAGIPNYPIYLLLGIVLWSFFSDMTNQSLTAVVGRSTLIRKISIPRWIVVLTSSISSLINLGLNLIIVLVFLLVAKVDLLQTSIWFPVVLFEIYVFAVGLSLILATAYVKYRDVRYIWEVLLQAGFYATPILYSISRIPESFQGIVLMNPMAQAIQDARYAVVTHDTITIGTVLGNGWYRLLPIGLCVFVLIVGIVYFKKQSKHFAEDL